MYNQGYGGYQTNPNETGAPVMPMQQPYAQGPYPPPGPIYAQPAVQQPQTVIIKEKTVQDGTAAGFCAGCLACLCCCCLAAAASDSPHHHHHRRW